MGHQGADEGAHVRIDSERLAEGLRADYNVKVGFLGLRFYRAEKTVDAEITEPLNRSMAE